MRFEVAPAPHAGPSVTVSGVMLKVVLALIPATVVYIAFFGPGILVNMAIAVAVAVACEAIMLRVRGRQVMPFLRDYSAVVAALLFAFALPPLTPWYLTALGIGFAIVFAKHLYGGLGYNTFNPAMVGYVVLLIAFPAEMSMWLAPGIADYEPVKLSLGQTLSTIFTGTLPPELDWDTITRATPLDEVRTGVGEQRMMSELRELPAFGFLGARGWEWISLSIAAGGAWLLITGVIRWHIPVGVLAGLAITAMVFYLLNPDQRASPVFHVFSGAAMLGAFFIATDPVSAATSERGRLIYGAGIGVLTYVIRTFGGYPDGIAFGVLLMNLAVPAIDHFTVPRAYGHRPEGKRGR